MKINESSESITCGKITHALHGRRIKLNNYYFEACVSFLLWKKLKLF